MRGAAMLLAFWAVLVPRVWAQPAPVGALSLADSLAQRRAQAPDSAKLRLLLADAAVLRRTEPAQSQQLGLTALALAVAQHRPGPQLAAQLLLGRLANAGGDFVAATRYLLSALQLAEQQHDTISQSSAYLSLSTTKKNLKQFAAGLEYARQAQVVLQPAARAGNVRAAKGLATAFNNSGTILMEQDQFAAARADFLISLRQARSLGDSGVAVLALYNPGGLALHEKQGAVAQGYYRQTLAIDQAQGNVQGQAESWLNLGDALAMLHQAAEAEAAYQHAL